MVTVGVEGIGTNSKHLLTRTQETNTWDVFSG